MAKSELSEAGSLSEASRLTARAAPWLAYLERHTNRSIGFRSAVDLCMGARFPMAVYWGDDFRFFYNDAFAPIIGARHPRAFARKARDFAPEIWSELEPMLRAVFATGESGFWEDFYVLREHENARRESYFSFSLSAIVDEFGERGVLLVATETTGSVLQVRAANENIAELSEFKKLADNISDIVYMHGSDGNLVWANERFYAFTGLSREASIAHDMWMRIMSPDDLGSYVAVLERSLPTRSPYEIEVRLKAAFATSEAYRWHLVRAKPMFDDDGFLLRWAGSATDIHDRRIAEYASRMQLERERDREHRASLAFQDAAMLKTLPTVPGLTFSAVYEPAEAEALVGGDWYDAFRLSDGRIVLSVGDVMGNGLASAVTMAGVRQAIRGAAQIYPDPASVLDAADRALRSEQPERIVTAFVAVLDPLLLSLTYASAGHPAPMLRLPTGEIVELSAPDLPLGLRSELRRGAAPRARVTIEPGSVLVIYTDGLTETTHDIFEGERRVREALSVAYAIDAHETARHLRDAVLVSSKDDVAILTVTFGDSTGHDVRETFDSRTRWSFPIVDAVEASSVRREIVDALTRLSADRSQAAEAELVLGELLGNVMRHAAGDVQIVLDLTGEAPVLHVIDDGPGFAFDARLPRDDMAESGRGLYIAAALTRDLNVVPRAEGGSHARAVLNVGVAKR